MTVKPSLMSAYSTEYTLHGIWEELRGWAYCISLHALFVRFKFRVLFDLSSVRLVLLLCKTVCLPENPKRYRNRRVCRVSKNVVRESHMIELYEMQIMRLSYEEMFHSAALNICLLLSGEFTCLYQYICTLKQNNRFCDIDANCDANRSELGKRINAIQLQLLQRLRRAKNSIIW